jgi:hypothetical protein
LSVPLAVLQDEDRRRAIVAVERELVDPHDSVLIADARLELFRREIG